MAAMGDSNDEAFMRQREKLVQVEESAKQIDELMGLDIWIPTI